MSIGEFLARSAGLGDLNSGLNTALVNGLCFLTGNAGDVALDITASCKGPLHLIDLQRFGSVHRSGPRSTGPQLVGVVLW